MKVKTKNKSKLKMKARAGKDRDPVENALEALRTVGKGFYNLCKSMVEIYDGEAYREHGYLSFEDCVTRHLKIEYRMALYYVQMGRSIIKHGLKEQQVVGMEWTKFKEVSSLFHDGLTSDEVAGIINDVKGKTFIEVQDYVKKEKMERIGGLSQNKVTMTFRMVDEAAEVVKSGLKIAMGLIGTPEESRALEFIVQDWQLNYSEEDAEKVKAMLKSPVKEEKVAPKKYSNAGKKKAKEDA